MQNHLAQTDRARSTWQLMLIRNVFCLLGNWKMMSSLFCMQVSCGILWLNCHRLYLQNTFSFMAVSRMPLRTSSLVARQDKALPWSSRVGVMDSTEVLALPSSDTCEYTYCRKSKQIRAITHLLAVAVHLQIAHPPGYLRRWPRSDGLALNLVFSVCRHRLVVKSDFHQKRPHCKYCVFCMH